MAFEFDQNGQVILTGMPASGKSTIGVLLAKSTCRDFIDTDLVLQRREKATLQQLIDQNGMEWFIQHETAAVRSLSQDLTPGIIATGGSVVLSDDAMKHLQSLGQIIFIDVPLADLKNRLHNIHTRGIAMTKDQNIDDIYRQRLPLYRKYADYVFDAGSGQVEELVDKLSGLLKIKKC